ncbi:MAG: flavin reductase family protein [Rhodospirillaceae bacterium]|nr:flavin reductase family protein [Rhodospirillaceae bacterium]
MFYEINTPHGLPNDPFKACVAPRPIGWISSLGIDGTPNLAPYSFFNAISGAPPMVMYASNGSHAHGPKDTVTNIEATGEFVVNVATWDLREQMNASSADLPPETDEFIHAGLTAAPSRLVKAPRVDESPINLECVHHQTIELPSDDPNTRNVMVIGRVVGVHIHDNVLVDGRIDVTLYRPLARLGYMDYAVVDKVFTMTRPT